MGKLELSEKWKSRKSWQKVCIVIAGIILVCLLFSLLKKVFKGEDDGARMTAASFHPQQTDDRGYMGYISHYGPSDYNGSAVQIDLLKDMVSGSTAAAKMEAYEGRDALLTTDEDTVTWNVTVPKAGLYAVKIDYYTAKGFGSTIERNLYIDGKYPFKEAEGVEFTRVYVDEIPNPSGMLNRPNQVERPSWCSSYVSDSMGYFTPALYFYLTEGKHTLTLESVKEPMAIASITLMSQDVSPASYAETLAATQSRGAQDVTGVLKDGKLTGLKFIQAENMLEKSSPTLYAKSDSTSTKNQPHSYTKKLLNTVGGTSWQYSNQWITWEVDVPVSGYYNIGARSKQNFLQDLYFNRSLYIDGELPFLEAENVHFYFDDDWQTFSFGESEGGEAWRFYLDAGKHTITLKNTVGDVVSILAEADSILESLSAINLQLLAILSTTPDTDRDYQIAVYLPDTLEELKRDEERLQTMCDAMIQMTGERGSLTSQLEMLIDITKKMHTKPNQIASYYKRYRDLTGSFGQWISSVREQPLMLDYLYLAEVGTTVKSSNDNFFNKIASQVMGFVTSFTNDYSMLSEAGGSGAGETITVWIGSGMTGGRDQAMALNQMIVDGFTREYGINVNLQLVPASTLKNAVFAGRGPDLALQVVQTEPVDFALRGAAYDLTQFSDFDEVAKRFSPNAIDPFKYNGGVYAMPETMSFPMLFYRTDIMADLGIDVSSLKTWWGITEILATLQAENMDFALPSAVSTDTSAGTQSFSMFLYQMGGDFYSPKHTKTLLDSKTALDAFEYWTDFYMLYGLATDYSFENRFRTGEMPIGIAEYTTYNLLSISAPEIKGKWAMTPVPGMVQADGTVNNVAPIIVQGCLMLKDCKNPDAAWKFVKWWTEADTQYEFGEQLEAVMGAAARYNTANTEALLRFAWAGNDRRSIEEQIQNLRGMPQVPGGYYTARYLNFAKLAVINDKENPRTALMNNAEDVNEEIRIKREEFGLEMEE